MKFPIHLLSLAGMCNLYAQPAPTFTKDIAPILQARCQVCHRPGEAAPFSLMTYEQTRSWAKAMREACWCGRCRRGLPTLISANSQVNGTEGPFGKAAHGRITRLFSSRS